MLAAQPGAKGFKGQTQQIRLYNAETSFIVSFFLTFVEKKGSMKQLSGMLSLSSLLSSAAFSCLHAVTLSLLLIS